MIRIRPLDEADLPQIRRWMWSAPDAPIWSDDDLAAIVKAPSSGQPRVRRGWVAETTNGMAGFVVATALSIRDTPAECELEFVFVAPEARRQGIGRMLLRTVFTWARNLTADQIRLEVRPSNTGALRLYQQSGFSITGYRPAYYVDPPEDAVLMQCPIEPNRCGDAPV